MKSNRLSSSCLCSIRGRTLAVALALTPLLAWSQSTLDPTFQPVITRQSGFGSAVAIQPDGKILLAGGFNAVDGTARSGIVRFAANGSVDPTFKTGAICCGVSGAGGSEGLAAISALTVQPDGRVLLGGSFTNVNGTARAGLARLNADGSLDPTFDPGTGLASTSLSAALLPVVSMIVQPDKKIVVGGYFTSVNGVPRSGLVRLNANGSVDTGFDPGTALSIGFPDFGPITGMALLSNGQLLVGGTFQAFADVKRPGLARLESNGSLDQTFNPAIYLLGGTPTLSGLNVQTDGAIIFSGNFGGIDDNPLSNLARLNSEGKWDPQFAAVIDDPATETDTVLNGQSGGKTLVYRQFNDANGDFHRVLTRLNADGSFDATFTLELAPSDGRIAFRNVAVQTDGAVLAAGSFTTSGNSTAQGIVRVNSGGAVDAAFHPQLEVTETADADVLAVAIQGDGKVLVGGRFTRINGVSRAALARLNSDGTLDAAFAPVLRNDDSPVSVAALAVQPDGAILVGGIFTTVNGTIVNGIVRLTANGTVDTTFDVGAGTKDNDGALGGVTALALQPDGKVLVAGGFTLLNSQSTPYLGRLNTNGSVDTGFTSGVGVCFICDPPDIRHLGVLSNSLIMVSGVFNRVDVFSVNGVARLLTNGTVDLDFKSPVLNTEQVTGMTVGVNGEVTIAVTLGDTVDGANHTRLIRFNANGTVDSNFKPAEIAGEGLTTAPVTALQSDAQGRLILGGQFRAIGEVAQRGIARLNGDGSLDTTFGAGASGLGSAVFPAPRNGDLLVTTIALEGKGSVLIGGSFATVDQQVRLGLARFQPDSSVPPPTGTLRLSGITHATGGTVSFLVTGESGRSYRIESSSDLKNWTTAGAVTGATTPQPFSDPNPSNGAQRFYRAVSP